tara:strand:+ start:15992 stop:18991 length:3000 start_codon:yes stop_codon:yes gene_type:complete
MITLDDEQKAAFQSGSWQPVVHVTVEDAADSTSIIGHNIPDGSILDSSVSGTAIISDIQSISQKIDPVSRAFQADQFTFTFCVDDAFRELSASKQWLDGVVTFKLGHPDLTFARYLTIFSGYVSEISFFENYINVEALVLTSKLKQPENLRTFVDEHPSTVLRQLLIDGGMASSLIDTTTFAPSAFPLTSHYVYSSRSAEYGGDWYDNDGDSDVTQLDIVNTHSNSPYEPPGWTPTDFRNAWRLNPQAFCDDYLKMARLALIWDPAASEFKLIQCVLDAAVQRHLTVNDYTDFAYEETIGPYNQTEIQVGSFDSTDKLIKKDATSISVFGKKPLKDGTKYLAPASLFTSAEGTGSSWAEIYPDMVWMGQGFAGSRDLVDGSQVADARISASNPFFGLWRTEVLKATSPHDPNDTVKQWVMTTDEEGDLDGSYTESFSSFLLQGVTRGVAGSEASDASTDSRAIIDLTAAVAYSDYALARFSNTCPIIKFLTGLDQIDLELGDTISIDNDFFFCPGLKLDGLDSNVRFEITSKEVKAVGDTVGIEFVAAYKLKTSPPSTSIDFIAPPQQRDWPMRTGKGIVSEFTTTQSVGTGLDVTAGSGLVATVAKGVSNCGGVVRNFSSIGSIPLTASKDNYIGIDGLTGQTLVCIATIDDPPPNRAPTEIRLAKVTTNGSAVTATDDLRMLGSVSVNQINKFSIPLPDNNYIFNPSFEIWTNTGMAPDGWEVIGGVTLTDFRIETNITHRGKYSLAMLDTATLTNLQSAKVPVQPGMPVRGSAWMYAVGGSPVFKFSAYWYKSTGAASSTAVTHFAGDNFAATGQWESWSSVQTAPSDAAYVALRIGRAASPGGIMYYDDVKVRLEPVGFRGSLTGSNDTISSSGDSIVFNTENHDYGSNYNNGTGVFTCPESGSYTFSTNISLVGTVGVRLCYVAIVGSTAGTLATEYIGNSANGTDEWNDIAVTLNVPTANLTWGETVSVKVYWDGTAAVVKHSFSDFSGRQIS